LRVLAVASPHNLNLGGPHASAKNSPKGTSVASSSSSRRDTNVAPARVAITSTATPEAATTTSETTAETPSTSTSSSAASGVVAVDDVLAPVSDDMVQLDMSVRNIVGQRNPMLMAAADQIFGAGGKKIRPAVVFLVSRATMQLHGTSEMNAKHRKLAEIIEMIHTASLVHDDVLDECDLRRGAATVNQKYGTRLAVLAGDFLFAQSSWFLANLDNLEVIKLISRVIADFADGEIAQASSLFDTSITVEQYVDKSFYKTASLIAASCRSAAALSDVSDEVKEACYEYGRALGIAFQIVDDVLDFTQSTETLGKPRGQDLASGNLTAPAIFALQRDAEADGQLLDIIDSEFMEEDSLERALGYVEEFGGLDAARKLAEEYAQKARDSLSVLPDSASKESLNLLVDYVLCRVY